MPTFSPSKNLKIGDCEFKTCKNLIFVKWIGNQAVTLIESNIGHLNQMSSVLRRHKGTSSKWAISYPILVKKYNQSMGGVDLCNQYTAAYHLDRRSNFRFYLSIFFDLMDVVMVDSFIIHDKLHPNALSFLDFKLVVSENLIGPFTTWTR